MLLSPGEAAETALGDFSFELRAVPPFRLDLTVWTLRRQPHNRMDRWDGRTYRRTLVRRGQPVEVAVTQEGPPAAPRLLVSTSDRESLPEDADFFTAVLERLLGFGLNLQEFYAFAARDSRLHQLVQQFRGVKPPRFPSLFETLVNAIACQQLSLAAGIHVLNRLTAAFGPALPGMAEAAAFPRPADLAGAAPADLRRLGFSLNKGRYVIDLARGVTEGAIDLESLARLPDEAASDFLQTLRGIGRWTAEYALLRGLGRWHIFPGDDVGARHKLQAWLSLAEPLDYQGVGQVLAPWRPYGGLLYFHMLLSQLAAEGRLS